MPVVPAAAGGGRMARMITSARTAWFGGDFMPEGQHTLPVRVEGDVGYCAVCGDHVVWYTDLAMAPPTLVHMSKHFDDARLCYTPPIPAPTDWTENHAERMRAAWSPPWESID